MATYKIFISGPSDVNDYIDIARTTILEINMLVGPLGVQFEPFDWLEAATPGIGEEPQAVINEQALGYAAIVAIVGAKVGSPTKNFESGTIEEIQKAIGKQSELPFGSKSVMVFFKETIIDLKTADLVQAAKVQELRSSLGPSGILFKDFKDEAKFRESLLRCFGIILAKHFGGSGGVPTGSAPPASDKPTPSDPAEEAAAVQFAEDDALGLLDLNDTFEFLMSDSTNGIKKISSEMTQLTDLMNEKSAQLDNVVYSKSPNQIKSIVGEVSSRMVDLSIIIDEEAPRVGETYGSAFQHLRALIDLLSSEFSENSGDMQMSALRDGLIGVMSSVMEAKEGLSTYIDSVKALPSLTKEVNKAKRKLASSSDRYLSVLDDIITETESMLEFINSKAST